MKLSLIIPCYNEEEALPYIYEELVKVSATLSDYEIEYLFVNDGSKDHTLDKLKELAAHDERVKYFRSHVTSARKLPCMPVSAMLPGIMLP